MSDQEVVGFYLADVINLLWNRKRVLLASGVAGLVLAVLSVLVLPSTYVAEGQVVVRAEASVSADSERSFYSTAINDAVVTTEREVMVAEGLLTRVVESVSFPPSYTEVSWIGSKLEEMRASVTQQPSMRASNEAAALRAARLVSVTNAVSTSVGKGSSVITVRAATTDARFSTDIVNRVLTFYMEDRLKAQQRSAHNVEVALRERLDQTRTEITRAEEKVSALMRQPTAAELAELQKERSPVTGKPLELQATLAARILEMDREKESLANLRRIAGTIEDRLIAVAAQPVDPNARILTWPQVPVRAAFPNKPLFCVIGLLGGLVLGAGLLTFREFMARSKATAGGQAGLLAGRLLGSIPYMKRMKSGVETLTLNFQGIAFQLEDVCRRDGFQVITITSCVPHEGKTTVAVNLALTLTQSGKRVLLINCDLHRSVKWTVNPRKQTGNSRPFEQIVPSALVSPRTGLDVLPLCTDAVDDPIAFFWSAEFVSLIEAARKEYDLILCDTPPVFSVPDAMLVARASDAVLLVTEESNAMDRTMSTEISRRISEIGRPICGVVLTKTKKEDVSYMTYGGYDLGKGSRTIIGALEAAMAARPAKAIAIATRARNEAIH